MLRALGLLLGLFLLVSASRVVPPPTTSPPPLSPCCALNTIASCFGYNATDSTAILQAALSCARAQTVKIDLPPTGVWNTQPLFIQGRRDLVVLIEAGTTLRAVRGAFRSSGSVLLVRVMTFVIFRSGLTALDDSRVDQYYSHGREHDHPDVARRLLQLYALQSL